MGLGGGPEFALLADLSTEWPCLRAVAAKLLRAKVFTRLLKQFATGVDKVFASSAPYTAVTIGCARSPVRAQPNAGTQCLFDGCEHRLAQLNRIPSPQTALAESPRTRVLKNNFVFRSSEKTHPLQIIYKVQTTCLCERN